MPDDPPPLRFRGFGLPKRGNAPEEYEDAFAGDAAAGRFAVADGASESAFAGPWARLLVEEFVRTPGSWAAWLPALRECWAAEVGGRPMAWYEEAKFQEGAFATLLAVQLGRPAGEGRPAWEAWAVGDSCLFHLREGRLLRAFPLDRSADFGTAPALVCSRPPAPQTRRPRRNSALGEWQPGDRLLLATDALAQWFLQQVEADRSPWEEVGRLETDAAFADWVGRLRDHEGMRNDDVTLVSIGEEPGGAPDADAGPNG